MVDKLFTDEFWQNLGALISRHPSVIILLLVVFGLGLIIMRWLDGREIRGLKAEKDAAETRLKLAQQEQKAVTPPIEILNNAKLEEDVARLKTEVAQIKVVLPQSLITQLDKVAANTATVTSTARVLSEANTVLGATLSSGSYLLIWDDHLGHSYSSEGTTIITQAIQIGAKNGPDRELRLEDAYIVSGQGSGEVKLKVGSDGGWIAPDQVSAIPINCPIIFRAEFTPTPAREFFDRWKTFRITIKHDGGAILTKDVDENMVAALYANFRPNPIGPQITAKA